VRDGQCGRQTVWIQAGQETGSLKDKQDKRQAFWETGRVGDGRVGDGQCRIQAGKETGMQSGRQAGQETGNLEDRQGRRWSVEGRKDRRQAVFDTVRTGDRQS
jgi:hypothetical protein